MKDLKSFSHQEIISLIKEKQYFDIRELVSKQVYEKFGESAWKFFDTKLLITLYFIRNKKGKYIIVNDWHKGGSLQQRGFRENICPIVKEKTNNLKMYVSAHTVGQGIDFTILNEKASDTRKWILKIEDELPFKIRLEYKYIKSGEEITWVHLDTYDEPNNPKVCLFNV